MGYGGELRNGPGEGHGNGRVAGLAEGLGRDMSMGSVQTGELDRKTDLGDGQSRTRCWTG